MANFLKTMSPVSKTLAAIVLAVVASHFLFHPARLLGMSTSLFYLDEEFTLGALLMFCLTFYCGILALELFFSTKQTKYLIWLAIFWTLSLDEYFSIHEYLNDLLKRFLDPENGLAQLASKSWVLTLGILFLIPAGYILYHLVREKDQRVRNLFLLGLCFYILILLIEGMGGQTYGKDIYIFFVGIEEGMEMIGTIFFIEAFRQKLKNNK